MDLFPRGHSDIAAADGIVTNLVACHREYGQAKRRVEVMLWKVGDEEGRGANAMNEHAKQELKTVQGKDGVADSLFDDPPSRNSAR